MKIKKTTNWMLMALLTIGLSMGFIACSDDDDDDSGGGPTNEAEYKEAGLGWDIITQLTAERKAPEGWQSMTFEPTIGKASETDPYTRVVATNDVAAAAERFSGLVGLPDLISETTTSFTYNQEGMGKLTYQMGSVGGQYLAQVDVDLKQVPHLKKILYQTPEQMGNNGSFAGTAYYRFGDVVMDKDGFYWICVRPAFGPEGKEDSHWMCFSRRLPYQNTEPYKTSTGIENYLPTGLGKSTEHMQNAAEMFYAMLHPNEWFETVMGGTGTSKPKMFNDFNTNKIQYHNTHFWQNVCNAWEGLDLFNLVLGVSKEKLASNPKWHMLYSGYSWWWSTSWNCYLYEATFKNGDGKKANMHDATYTSPMKDMHDILIDAIYINPEQLVIAGKPKNDRVGTVNGPFFDNDTELRWYVRYKKGSELGGGNYNVKSFISECTDVYTYNSAYGFNDLNDGPEITTPAKSRGFYAMGDVVEDMRGSRWVCVQESPTNSDEYPNFAYFISFDYRALGEDLSALPSKNLGMQILFDLSYLIHNNIGEHNTSFYDYACKSIKKYAGVDIYELCAIRDSLHTYKNGVQAHVLNEFISTLYRDDDGKLCVLRMISDNTASQPGNGSRDWSWRFYDSYTQNLTSSPRRMLLEDLADLSVIRAYNKDRWVTCPWYNPQTSERTPPPGYLTTTQNVGPARFFYQAGRTYLNGAPTNMYREPIIVFAVKRLIDPGREVHRFIDGTTFEKVHYVSADDWAQYDNTYDTSQFLNLYTFYQHQMFLNDKSYLWGMYNPK